MKCVLVSIVVAEAYDGQDRDEQPEGVGQGKGEGRAGVVSEERGAPSCPGAQRAATLLSDSSAICDSLDDIEVDAHGSRDLWDGGKVG
jgi:hypothetical protein